MKVYKGYNAKMSEDEVITLADTIRNELKDNVVQFNFYRITYGSSRWALGTTDFNIITSFGGDLPMGSGPFVPGLIRYFDLSPRHAWRSFYINNVNEYKVYDRKNIANILNITQSRVEVIEQSKIKINYESIIKKNSRPYIK